VRDFELAHGEAPASAQRVLDALEGDAMAGAGVDASSGLLRTEGGGSRKND
jgi:hypothetical protein